MKLLILVPIAIFTVQFSSPQVFTSAALVPDSVNSSTSNNSSSAISSLPQSSEILSASEADDSKDEEIETKIKSLDEEDAKLPNPEDKDEADSKPDIIDEPVDVDSEDPDKRKEDFDDEIVNEEESSEVKESNEDNSENPENSENLENPDDSEDSKIPESDDLDIMPDEPLDIKPDEPEIPEEPTGEDEYDDEKWYKKHKNKKHIHSKRKPKIVCRVEYEFESDEPIIFDKFEELFGWI